jgi:hypothetical protein
MNKSLISRAMRELANHRWAQPGASNPGRPRSTDRCPCGKYTKHTAQIRHHDCHEPSASGATSPPSGRKFAGA